MDSKLSRPMPRARSIPVTLIVVTFIAAALWPASNPNIGSNQSWQLRQFAPPILLAWLAGSASLLAQSEGIPQNSPPPLEPPLLRTPADSNLFRVLGKEVQIYGSDAAALGLSPFHWDAGDWKKAAGAGLILAALFTVDKQLDHSAQSVRSPFSDSASSVTAQLGGAAGLGLSGGLLAGGLISGNSNVRDMGRDALEASALSGLLVNLVLKPVFGRERPTQSDGRTDFDPLGGGTSFPSGHATEAFAVASVIAARSSGWVVPALAYTLASLVGFSRMNDRAHFASDVFAGAALGTLTGRFIVHRHETSRLESERKATFTIVPSTGGLAARITF